MTGATIVNSESSTVPDGVHPARLPLGGFHHIGITVCDVDASEAWYARVLGFERLVVEPHNGADGSALLMHRPGGHLHIGLDNHKANEGEPFAEHRTGSITSPSTSNNARTSTGGLSTSTASMSPTVRSPSAMSRSPSPPSSSATPPTCSSS